MADIASMVDIAGTESGTVRVTGSAAAGQAGFVGVVAIDGPSGSGKSTVARRLADRLGVAYLDTGAMYRAAAWAVLHAGIDPADVTGVADVVAGSELEIGIDPTAPQCRMNGVDVSGPIRGAQVTAAVSAVAANPAVRRVLVAQQQTIIAAAVRGELECVGMINRYGIVAEGRDIATAVAPDALLKVYLTASQTARTKRRQGDAALLKAEQPESAETAGTGAASESETAAHLARVAQELQRRDTLDSSRATDPLRIADDAVVLDTTELGIDDVITQLVALHAAALATASDAAAASDTGSSEAGSSEAGSSEAESH
ncbi:MAG: (d)CMP kinase [Mycobacteriales bacterium]